MHLIAFKIKIWSSFIHSHVIQTYMWRFFRSTTKEDILWNGIYVHPMEVNDSLVTNVLQNIFRVLEKKESHTETTGGVGL